MQKQIKKKTNDKPAVVAATANDNATAAIYAARV